MAELDDKDEWVNRGRRDMQIALEPADFGYDVRVECPIGLDDKDEWQEYQVLSWYHQALRAFPNMQIMHIHTEMHYPRSSDFVGTIRLRDDLQTAYDEKQKQLCEAEATIAEVTDSIIQKPKPPTDLSHLRRKDKIVFGPSLLERLVAKPKPQRRWIR